MKKNALTPVSEVQSWINQNEDKWLEDFYTFLRFPSVSSESQYKQGVLDCAAWLMDYLKNLGFQVEAWPTFGHPVIFASSMQAGPNQPTLLIYHHYDVQPPDPVEEWISPPFDPQLRQGKIYARGAQDNKGQCFYTLQALKFLHEHRGSYPINIKLCIEGEEEMGSAGLASLLDQKRELLKADYLAIVDLGLRKASQPAITLGIRGILTLDVEVKGSNSDLHSGSHGGIVYNPIHTLVKLLAGLRDDKGRINIPHFYDGIAPITSEELEKIKFEFDPKEYQHQTGAVSSGGEVEYSPLERAWIRPTLEINGIHGGYTGSGFKTVIPSKAYAKISCRLVPNQQPEAIGTCIENYFKKHTPPGMEVSVHLHPGQGKAVRVSPHSGIVTAFAKAFEEVFNAPCEFIFEGGSIPIVSEMAEVCEGEVVLLGLGLSTDQIHAPNEHFGIDRLKNGIIIMIRALESLSKNQS